MRVKEVAAWSWIILAAAAPCLSEERAEVVVSSFYTKYMAARPSGLPSESEMAELAPLMSERLLALFRAARDYQSAYRKSHPDSKPPFVDGCLFTSLFEGPGAFAVGRREDLSDGPIKVFVEFSAQDSSKPAEVIRWEDAVILIRENGRLVIDDILFLGQWPFKIGAQLSRILEARD